MRDVPVFILCIVVAVMSVGAHSRWTGELEGWRRDTIGKRAVEGCTDRTGIGHGIRPVWTAGIISRITNQPIRTIGRQGEGHLGVNARASPMITLDLRDLIRRMRAGIPVHHDGSGMLTPTFVDEDVPATSSQVAGRQTAYLDDILIHDDEMPPGIIPILGGAPHITWFLNLRIDRCCLAMRHRLRCRTTS